MLMPLMRKGCEASNFEHYPYRSSDPAARGTKAELPSSFASSLHRRMRRLPLPTISSPRTQAAPLEHDSSTAALIGRYRRLRG
jgi:hypothetical protein